MISNVLPGSAPAAKSASSKGKPTAQASVTPDQFAQSHSAFLESTLAPLARSIGARALSGKLNDAIREEARKNENLALLSDNLKQISEDHKGSVPLKEVYQIDQQQVKEAAEQAAKSSAGALTAESARFLPQDLKADYQHLTGQTISDQPGIAVDGVSVKAHGNKVDVAINFEKALAGARAKEVVLALTDTVTLAASRLEGVEDPNIPPYWITISPREGKLPGGAQVNSGHGWSSFSSPDSGHLIRAGHTEINLYRDYNDKTPLQTLDFDLDKVNDYGSVPKPASQATQGVRGAWEAQCEEGGFNFEAGTKAGKLEAKTLAQARDLPGTKVLFKAIRENTGQSITRLVKQDLLEFAVDKHSNSLGVLRRVDGESEQWLSVVDLNKGRWVGTWSIGDDGTREWSER